MKTYIVMPIANEEDTIEHLLEFILSLGIPDLHLAVVMDAYSKDNTYEIVKGMGQQNSDIELLLYEESSGVVSCYLYGFKHALKQGADYIVEMDGGGSHDPSEISNFIQRLNEGYDCVFGSRFMTGGGIENHPLFRRMLSKYGTILANLVLGTKLADMTSGYEAFRGEVLEKIDLNNMLSINISHFFQTEIRYYCSELNICEIPITYRGSESSLKLMVIFKSLTSLFVLKKRGVIPGVQEDSQRL